MKKNFFSAVVFISLLLFFADNRNLKGFIVLQAPLPVTVTDSLLKVLKTAPADTGRVEVLNTISRQYLNTGDYEIAMSHAVEAQQLAEKLNYTKGLGNAYSNKGVIFWYQGESEKALENHLLAIQYRNECADVQGVANSYNNIGLVYLNLSNYEKSLENNLKALKIREEIGDKNGTANSCNNIGVIYQKQNSYDKAIENYEKALKLRQEVGDKFGIGMSYNNIGLIYLDKKEYREAVKNLLKGLAIREEIGDKKGMADSYLNLGTLYYQQQKYEKALEFVFKAAGINERIGNKRGIGLSYANIGTCYLRQNNLDAALLYLNKGIKILNEIGNKDGKKDAYSALSAVYEQKGDYKKAYDYQAMYADLKDTLFDEQASEQMTEMNAKYESEKKNKELVKKDAEIARQQAEAEKQALVRNSLIIGFLLVVMLAFLIYRGYKQKQKANLLLDRKNEQITDSINYARHIQDSLFPPVSQVRQCLPEFFVFHRPKDIVSGDLYWFAETGDGGRSMRGGKRLLLPRPPSPAPRPSILLAAVDCTGHGVPGAFMSMMAYNLLEQVVKTHHLYQPAAILNEMSRQVAASLRQTDVIGKVNDGMDIALLRLLPGKEETTGGAAYGGLEYAGAHNSLYLIRNGILHETKADKAFIGFSLEKSFAFTHHSIKLEKGDCCYIFTDGFIDQFGGPDNEKFYYQPFRELLVKIHQLSMEEQKHRLENVFSEWKGNKSQIDDVLVMGFRV